MQALRKPLEKVVGITAPRICVETITPSLVSIVEVSQASHIQDEDITPLYYFKCNEWNCFYSTAKVQKLLDKRIVFEVISIK